MRVGVGGVLILPVVRATASELLVNSVSLYS
jgi:hypothetical protein